MLRTFGFMNHEWMAALTLSLLASCFMGCNREELALPSNSLQSYLDENPQWQPFNQLVACAAGGQVGFLDDPDRPLSMFFYPKLYSTNFRYYESAGIDIDTGDLTQFIEKTDVFVDPLFNGFMARFPLDMPATDRWARVSFVSNDTLWYCKPVRYKMLEKPSIFDPELVQIELNPDLQPTFSWAGEQDESNIIYFQIVVDERGDALSATYTTQKHWSYYDLTHVVFNVTRPGPVLPLQEDKSYEIVLMGISADNWVNTLSSKKFQTTR